MQNSSQRGKDEALKKTINPDLENETTKTAMPATRGWDFRRAAPLRSFLESPLFSHPVHWLVCTLAPSGGGCWSDYNFHFLRWTWKERKGESEKQENTCGYILAATNVSASRRASALMVFCTKAADNERVLGREVNSGGGGRFLRPRVREKIKGRCSKKTQIFVRGITAI